MSSSRLANQCAWQSRRSAPATLRPARPKYSHAVDDPGRVGPSTRVEQILAAGKPLFASVSLRMEDTGIEPVTFALPARRSPS